MYDKHELCMLNSKKSKKIKLDKHNIVTIKKKKKHEKYCLAIKRQIAKLSPKKSPAEMSFFHTRTSRRPFKNDHSIGKKNRYLASFFLE